MNVLSLSWFLLLVGLTLFFSLVKSIFNPPLVVTMKWDLVFFHNFDFSVSFLIDKISLCFFSVLLVITGSVFNFGVLYMEGESKKDGFFLILSLFVGSMVLIIFTPNFFFLLLGWDGLGVTSFLLIIYYLSGNSWVGGFKTYLVKRLGDGLIMGSLGFLLLKSNSDFVDFYKLKILLGFLVLLGLITKSAQFPFGSWLPLAMEAPTPVSALVHSSTLVTAGVYVLMRISDGLSLLQLNILGVLSVWTMFIASFAACFEWDSKKIVAYSTLSQLGFMCVALSLGFTSLAFFHLVSHAVFKSLLFISVGSKILFSFHFQDIRLLKSLSGLNVNSMVLCLSLMSLSGFPFLTGFFSKDSILESGFYVSKLKMKWILFLSVGLTCLYSVRLFFMLKKKQNPFYFFSPVLLSTPSFLPLLIFSLCLGSYFPLDGFFYTSSLEKMILYFFMAGGVFLSQLGYFYSSSFFFTNLSFSNFLSGFKFVKKVKLYSTSLKIILDKGFNSHLLKVSGYNLEKVGIMTKETVSILFTSLEFKFCFFLGLLTTLGYWVIS